MRVLMVSDNGFQFLNGAMPAMERRGVVFHRLGTRDLGRPAGESSKPARRSHLPRYLIGSRQIGAFRRVVDSFAPDLIHVMGGRPNVIVTLLAARAYPGIPVVYERISAGGVNILSPIDQWMFRGDRIAKIFMPTRSLLNHWMGSRHLRKLARPERCDVLNYAIDVPPLMSDEERRAARKSLGLDDDAFVIGTVANLRKWKNIEFAAQVVSSLRTDRPVCFAVVGQPSRDDAYTQKIRSAGGGRLKMLGYVRNARRIMGAFDLHLTPSRLPGETFGLAFAEAMAAGVPAISMNYGGCADIAVHGATGFCLRESPSEWRRHIESLLQDPALLREMGAAARRRIEDRFSAEIVADEWHRLNNSVIAERAH